MRDKLRRLVTRVADAFWLLPLLLTLAGAVAAVLAVEFDRGGGPAGRLPGGRWVYDGGAEGARTILAMIAASALGVAGTVFSITIAALSLTAGQMGPRLLHSFKRDRGVQLTLGTLLGSFVYALGVLRSVRADAAGSAGFTPQLAMTLAFALAIACVGVLVYFVGHMAGRINVETVLGLVGDELRHAITRLTVDTPTRTAPSDAAWDDAVDVVAPVRGYLQQLDADGLADWAAERGAALRLLVRPGDMLFPGVPCAIVRGPADGAAAALAAAMVTGPTRVSAQDLEFAVRQLVEVAVRALSPGINDPHTAIGVLDRLGASLCEIAPRHLAGGVIEREGQVRLVVDRIDYPGLVDAMFHLIRQSSAGSPAVLIRMLEVLTAVAQAERQPDRRAELRRHAALVADDAERGVAAPSDLADVRARHAAFERVLRDSG